MDLNSVSNNKFNVAFIKMNTKIEGPFNRCCIWFQGCSILCKGCCNVELQQIKIKHIVDENQLLSIVKKAKLQYNIEGITLSGGEPSLQKGLISFNQKIKEMDLGIIMFSGRYKEELSQDLVNSVDLLIDGPYIEEKHDTNRLLIGSTNKRLNFITDRYKDNANYFNNSIALEEVEPFGEQLFINGD